MAASVMDSRRTTLLLLTVSVLLTGAARAEACACQRAGSICQEVTAGSTVFIGTVESISPRFLDHWNLSRRPSMSEIVESDDRFLHQDSAAGLEALKSKIREKLPDLPSGLLKQLSAAKDHDAVVSVFDAMLSRGRVVHFRVSTLFSRGGDDDDPDDDDDDAPKSLDVTTPFGDCGFDFQNGETYLVYAVSDEGTPLLETGRCTATKRLSDAGADLAYLHFFKDSSGAASHLDGIATSDPQLAVRPFEDVASFADAGKPGSLLAGLVIGIKSADSIRYTTSTSQGRFVFDGLAPGQYALSAWAPGYPDSVKLLAGPSEIRVQKKSCLNHTMLVPAP